MMRKKTIIILIAVFVVGFFSAVLISRILERPLIPQLAPPKPHPSRLQDFLTTHLSLSKSQQEKVQTLLEEHHNEVVAIQTELYQENRKLMDLISDPSGNREKIEHTVDEIISLQSQLTKTTVTHLTRTRQVLTEEQWEKFLFFFREKFPGPREGPQTEEFKRRSQ